MLATVSLEFQTPPVLACLETTKRFLESLKHEDLQQIHLLRKEAEKIHEELLRIDPRLIGQTRSRQAHRTSMICANFYYGSRKFFAIRIGFVTPRLERLRVIDQAIESTQVSSTLKTQEIERLSHEILKFDHELKERAAEKKVLEASKSWAAKLLVDLHQARQASVTGLKVSPAPLSSTLASKASAEAKEEDQESKAPLENPASKAMAAQEASKSDHEKFIEALARELARLEIPEEFCLDLIRSLFPEVLTFSKTEGGLFQITFKGSFQFSGTLCGVKATIINPLILKLEIDPAKKTLFFEKEKYSAKTGLGNGYLAALNFTKKGSVILESLLKKGFNIPISGCYTYQEFKEAFGDIRWTPC